MRTSGTGDAAPLPVGWVMRRKLLPLSHHASAWPYHHGGYVKRVHPPPTLYPGVNDDMWLITRRSAGAPPEDMHTTVCLFLRSSVMAISACLECRVNFTTLLPWHYHELKKQAQTARMALTRRDAMGSMTHCSSRTFVGFRGYYGIAVMELP